MPTFRKRWRKYARKRGLVLAVVDNSVLVSALINRKGQPARIVRHLGRCHFWLVSSSPLLDEFKNVLMRLRTKYAFAQDDVVRVQRLVQTHASVVQIKGDAMGCRDRADDMVLETAVRGRATHLITRDDDLKDDPVLRQRMKAVGVEITTVSRFLKLLEQ